ncbi:ATP-binding cassette sub-family A member 2, partial [Fragariocoptes setiger]
EITSERQFGLTSSVAQPEHNLPTCRTLLYTNSHIDGDKEESLRLERNIRQSCSVDLTKVDSREQLIRTLDRSLAIRRNVSDDWRLTSECCHFDLQDNQISCRYSVGNDTVQDENGKTYLYRLGLEIKRHKLLASHQDDNVSSWSPELDYEIFLTDVVSSMVIHMPSSMSQMWSESSFVFGPIRSGQMHLDACIIRAAYQMIVNHMQSNITIEPQPTTDVPRTTTATTAQPISTATATVAPSTSKAPPGTSSVPQPTAITISTTQPTITATTTAPLTTATTTGTAETTAKTTTATAQTTTSTIATPTSTTKHATTARANSIVNFADTNSESMNPQLSANISWRIEPSSRTLADSSTMRLIFVVSILSAWLINVLFTVKRVVDDIEMGVFHYLRISGVPSTTYWLSHLLVTFAHLTIQSFVVSIILTLPVSPSLFDPFYEATFSVKFTILTVYSWALICHVLAVSSFFEHTSHALIFACILGILYSLFEITFNIEWTPVCYSDLWLPKLFMLFPVSMFDSICIVLAGVRLKSERSFTMADLSRQLNNKHSSTMLDTSVAALLGYLVLQSVLWWTILLLRDRSIISQDPLSLETFLTWIAESFACCCPRQWMFYCCQCCPDAKHIVSFPSLESQIHQNRAAPRHSTAPVGLAAFDPQLAPNTNIACSLKSVHVSGPCDVLSHKDKASLIFRSRRLRPSELIEQIIHQQHLLSVKSQKTNSVSVSASHSMRKTSSVRSTQSPTAPIIRRQVQSQLKNVTVDFAYNQITCLLGASPQKHLLFATLMALRRPKAGTVTIDGHQIGAYNCRKDMVRRTIGYLGERDIYFENLSIFDNLQFFGSIRDPEYRAYDSESNFVLTLLHLSMRRDSLPTVLTTRSGRKLSLASAIVGYTKILLLVEPTLGLRWKPRCHVLNLLRKYKSIRSLIIDTSDVDEAVAFGDKIVLLNTNGGVEIDDPPEHLKRSLNCGYRIHLTNPTSPNSSSAIDQKLLASIERYTNELFGELKPTPVRLVTFANRDNQSVFELRALLRLNLSMASTKKLSQFYELLSINLASTTSSPLSSSASKLVEPNLANLRIASVELDSLEDVICARMSASCYPDLPPDLMTTQSVHELRARATDDETKMEPLVKFGPNPWPIVLDRFKLKYCFKYILLGVLIPILVMTVTLLLVENQHYNHTRLTLTSDSLMDHYGKRIALHPILSEHYNDKFIYQTKSNDPTMRHSKDFELYEHRSNREKNHQNWLPWISQYWDGNLNYVSSSIDNTIDGSNKQIEQLQQDNVTEDTRISAYTLTSSIFYDPYNGTVIIIYDDTQPHAAIGSIQYFGKFLLTLANARPYVIKHSKRKSNYSKVERAEFKLSASRYQFEHDWHQFIGGHFTRRYFYAFGLAASLACALELDDSTVIDRATAHLAQCLLAEKSFDESGDSIYDRGQFSNRWNIYIMTLFGILAWIFLIIGENSFGKIARGTRRFPYYWLPNLTQQPISPRKPAAQAKRAGGSHSGTESSASNKFEWIKERARLINEYMKYMNDRVHAQRMSDNCVFVRIWLKPMGQQHDTAPETLLKAIEQAGQSRHECRVELRTTLQMFIRIGNEDVPIQVTRNQLIGALDKLNRDTGESRMVRTVRVFRSQHSRSSARTFGNHLMSLSNTSVADTPGILMYDDWDTNLMLSQLDGVQSVTHRLSSTV